MKLLQKIDREAEKNGRIIDCLLEFHIAEEMTKSGLSFEEARHILDSEEYAGLNHVRIVGVMGIATYTDNREQIRAEFHHLKQIFEKLEVLFFTDKSYFKEISMGMSEDYNIAVEEGATMVRIGSSIFGSRIYK